MVGLVGISWCSWGVGSGREDFYGVGKGMMIGWRGGKGKGGEGGGGRLGKFEEEAERKDKE